MASTFVPKVEAFTCRMNLPSNRTLRIKVNPERELTLSCCDRDDEDEDEQLRFTTDIPPGQNSVKVTLEYAGELAIVQVRAFVVPEHEVPSDACSGVPLILQGEFDGTVTYSASLPKANMKEQLVLWIYTHQYDHEEEKGAIASYFKSEKLSDVDIQVGLKKIPAHRLVLVDQSHVFEKMFENEMPGSKKRVIKIEGYDTAVVEEFLEYLYTGSSKNLSEADEEIETEAVLELFSIGHRYDVKPLTSKCEQLLAKHLNPDNVVKIFEQAVLFRAHSLSFDAKQFFTRKRSLIIPSADAMKDFLSAHSPETIFNLGFN